MWHRGLIAYHLRNIEERSLKRCRSRCNKGCRCRIKYVVRLAEEYGEVSMLVVGELAVVVGIYSWCSCHDNAIALNTLYCFEHGRHIVLYFLFSRAWQQGNGGLTRLTFRLPERIFLFPFAYLVGSRVTNIVYGVVMLLLKELCLEG